MNVSIKSQEFLWQPLVIRITLLLRDFWNLLVKL